jgi:hypothetical protein
MGKVMKGLFLLLLGAGLAVKITLDLMNVYDYRPTTKPVEYEYSFR